MSDKEYLQAASVRTILGEIIDGHMVIKRDGTVYDFSPDCDKMTFNERQCCNEILRRFAALEAERDALKARLAEAERVIGRSITPDRCLAKDEAPVTESDIVGFLLRDAIPLTQPPTAEGGDHGNE